MGGEKMVITIFDKLFELLLPTKLPHSAPWQEVFIQPLPDGFGQYEFRADLYDKSDEETAVRETAHIVTDGVYKWVLGLSPITHLLDPGPGDVQTPIAMPAITITADEVRHGDTVLHLTRK
jgi:hypothetical protein